MSKTNTAPLRVWSGLASQFPTTPTAVALLLVDLIALFGFLAVGQYKHGYLFWENPSRTLLLLSPILCLWVILALPTGLFTESSLQSSPSTAAKLVSVWVVVAILNGLLRRTDYITGTAPESFFIVSIVFGVLFLFGGRLLVMTLVRIS
ncbi:DUF3054 family protein [Halovenus halobia]|uniref:DUF3054 family protein n=1 Tax=Halovenus halobia TaxID=3396622 RepID=UPI003F567393